MTIQDRVYEDFLKFKEQEMSKDIEAVFSNAYEIAIAGEWCNFMQESFQDMFLDSRFVPETKKQEMIDLLMGLPNIIEALLGYVEVMDSVDFSPQAFQDYFYGYLRHEHDFEI